MVSIITITNVIGNESVSSVRCNEGFIVPKATGFSHFYEKRNKANIDYSINRIFEIIENDNHPKFKGIFYNIDFNSEANLRKSKGYNHILKTL
ncbi:type I restriction-modification system subunit M N-terminal domain-containing protein [Candidatus Liberibacter solanacearum]|uniref:type I restriction-modification system subunit M N-terminal domain-containing protein n=1 Tax=Candidatus Liberibacter solanacearum TaxID=556287 RepID=UPI00387DC62A